MIHFFSFVIALTITLSATAQGKVGINTTTPAAMLHVMDSSVLFTGFNPLPVTPANPPVSGEGTRMMWYPDKAAFRAGRLNAGGATFWNKDSIGLHSIAMGFNTKAKGSQSIAMGTATTASGSNSTALGTGSLANGNYSIAMGAGSTASGSYSTGMGFYTNANGQYSTAIGYQTIASGLTSTAMGHQTTADNDYSTAMGYQTTASASYATAMGYGTTASGFRSTALGNETIASGDYATAMGSETVANGYLSIAMGYLSVANGNISTALGYQTTAGSTHSTAMGKSTYAGGNASTAMGSGTMATGLASTAMGSSTKASGEAATTMGSFSTAGGKHATSIGTYTKAKGYSATVVGMFNDSILLTNQTSVTSTTPLFIIGNGDNVSTVANAMTVLKNGNVAIGNDVSPDARLHISKGTGGGDYHASSSVIIEDNADHFLQFSNPNINACGILSGNSNTDTRSAILFFGDSSITFRAGGNLTRMTIENNGYVGIGTTSPDYLLEVNGTAGKPGGGSWANSSDLRLKQNIHPYTDGLEKILKINPVKYHYNELSGYDTDPEFVGVIAQELKEIAPYMVSVSSKQTDDGVNDYLSVDNSAMTYMLINAVKEQQQIIRDQQATMDFLMKELSAVKSQLDKMNQDANTIVEK